MCDVLGVKKQQIEGVRRNVGEEFLVEQLQTDAVAISNGWLRRIWQSEASAMKRSAPKPSQKPVRRTAIARSTTPIPNRRKKPRRSGQLRDRKYLDWLKTHRCFRDCHAWRTG